MKPRGARTPAISITRPHPSVEDVPETKAQQEKQGYANVVSSYLGSGMRTKGLGSTTESHIENSIAIKAHYMSSGEISKGEGDGAVTFKKKCTIK